MARSGKVWVERHSSVLGEEVGGYREFLREHGSGETRRYSDYMGILVLSFSTIEELGPLS